MTATTTKHHMNFDQNCSDEDVFPALKVTKIRDSAPPPNGVSTPHRSFRFQSASALSFPAFTPREDYVKLSFTGNPSVDVELR